MAKRSDFKMSSADRQRRRFSDEFKKKKVHEIERGDTRVIDIIREYHVSSAAVYKWLRKFGTEKQTPERIIVESKSDTAKLQELRDKIAKLEQIIGQKQIQIDFQDKMIDLAESHYRVDIKKKFSGKPSSFTGKTEKR